LQFECEVNFVSSPFRLVDCWVLLSFFDCWVKPPSQEPIHWIHPRCMSDWNLYKQTTVAWPNDPWDHGVSHARSFDNHRATMQMEHLHSANYPQWCASPRPRWCKTTFIAPISTDKWICLENLKPRERRQESQKNKGERTIKLYHLHKHGTNERTTIIVIVIVIQFCRCKITTTNSQPHQIHISRTGSMWPGIDVTKRQGIISISSSYHYHAFHREHSSFELKLNARHTLAMNNGWWTMEQCHNISSAWNYLKDNKKRAPY
jgi:hypothetical protein